MGLKDFCDGKVLWCLFILILCRYTHQQNAGNTAEDFEVHEQSAGVVIGIVFGCLIGLAVIIGVIVCICVFVTRKKKRRLRVQRREVRQQQIRQNNFDPSAPPPYSLEAPPAYTEEAPPDPPPFFQGYRNPEILLNNRNPNTEENGLPTVS